MVQHLKLATFRDSGIKSYLDLRKKHYIVSWMQKDIAMGRNRSWRAWQWRILMSLGTMVLTFKLIISRVLWNGEMFRLKKERKILWRYKGKKITATGWYRSCCMGHMKQRVWKRKMHQFIKFAEKVSEPGSARYLGSSLIILRYIQAIPVSYWLQIMPKRGR